MEKKIMSVLLDPVKHRRTGIVKQYVNNLELLELPKFLEIVQIGTDPGFYLLQFDFYDVELTDTYHESLAEAKEQAKSEFGVSLDEWIVGEEVRE